MSDACSKDVIVGAGHSYPWNRQVLDQVNGVAGFKDHRPERLADLVPAHGPHPVPLGRHETVIDTLSDYLPDIALPAFVSDRVTEARQQLGSALSVELPEGFGQLTVVSDDALSSLPDGALMLNRTTWFVVAATAIASSSPCSSPRTDVER